MAEPHATVVIIGTVDVRPEHRDTFDALMARLRDSTRREPGCVGFSHGPDASDPGAVLVQEEYASQSAFDLHGEQPYVADYAAALPGLLAAPVTFRIYEVSGHRTLTLGPS